MVWIKLRVASSTKDPTKKSFCLKFTSTKMIYTMRSSSEEKSVAWVCEAREVMKVF